MVIEETLGNLDAVCHLVDLCRRHGWTVACAESMTGGLLAMAITTTPGPGDVFRGSIVSYHREAKHELFKVRERQVVTAAAALEMAHGACERFDSDLGIGVTGVAGPARMEGVEVGTVFVAATVRRQVDDAAEHHFGGEPAAVRLQAVLAAAEVALDVAASAEGKNEKQYEALKDEGMSKARAARIANSPDSSTHGGEASHAGRGSSSQGGTTAQHKAAGRKGGKATARQH
jgi:nicotinamide-nucleotide amidase